jgi:hypothetical protein
VKRESALTFGVSLYSALSQIIQVRNDRGPSGEAGASQGDTLGGKRTADCVALTATSLARSATIAFKFGEHR